MQAVDVVVETNEALSIRARQVCGMFDCPPQAKQRREWHAQLPIDERDWNVGIIVGPSGSGKSQCARAMFPADYSVRDEWGQRPIIDEFPATCSIETIAEVLNAVGFSTIPAWLRPHGVLSNGEQFRANIARRLTSKAATIVVDEFTSVVDRQVACIACNSIQKRVRKTNRRFVGVSCHYDIVDWLQPDWIFEPATLQFQWRLLQRRPEIEIEIARVPFAVWPIFAPFHYMSAELNKAARCFGLWANGRMAAFVAVLHRPHPKAKNIKGVSRVVTLPDFQGIGLSHVLGNSVASAYAALGYRFRHYPAHPPFVASFRRDCWVMVKPLGTFNTSRRLSGTTSLSGDVKDMRPCAVFEYIGPKMNRDDAVKLVG